MYADLPLLFCGSGLAREGGLPADLNLADVPRPCGSGLAREGGLPADLNLADVPRPCGSGLARDDVLPANTFLCTFPQTPGKSPTRFSGCPSEARSLAFVGHCKFSDRVWSPGFRMAHSAARAAFLCLLNGEPCVGGPRPCRVSIPWSTNLRTVRHPSAWSQ